MRVPKDTAPVSLNAGGAARRRLLQGIALVPRATRNPRRSRRLGVRLFEPRARTSDLYAVPRWAVVGGDDRQSGSRPEDAVVRDEGQVQPDGGGRDPSVAIMDFVAERVADLLAPQPEFGAHRDRLVIRLDDGELGEPAFESPSSQLALPSAEGSVAEFHHCLERDENRLRADAVAIAVSERVGAVVEQPADDHRVHDRARRLGVGHASASASWNAVHSSSGTSLITSWSRGGSGRARLSASLGGYTRTLGFSGFSTLDTALSVRTRWSTCVHAAVRQGGLRCNGPTGPRRSATDRISEDYRNMTTLPIGRVGWQCLGASLWPGGLRGVERRSRPFTASHLHPDSGNNSFRGHSRAFVYRNRPGVCRRLTSRVPKAPMRRQPRDRPAQARLKVLVASVPVGPSVPFDERTVNRSLVSGPPGRIVGHLRRSSIRASR